MILPLDNKEDIKNRILDFIMLVIKGWSEKVKHHQVKHHHFLEKSGSSSVYVESRSKITLAMQLRTLLARYIVQNHTRILVTIQCTCAGRRMRYSIKDRHDLAKPMGGITFQNNHRFLARIATTSFFIFQQCVTVLTRHGFTRSRFKNPGSIPISMIDHHDRTGHRCLRAHFTRVTWPYRVSRSRPGIQRREHGAAQALRHAHDSGVAQRR